MGEQHDLVRREFTEQVGDFEAPGSVFGDLDVLNWIDGHVPVSTGDRLLDVAGGTGSLGRHLGRRAAATVVVDVTPAMLEEGRRACADRDDVSFLEADAAALPFEEASFDVVVCRFALHHMEAPVRALAEMARVRRRGGTVAIVDVVAADGPLGDRQNELERLRDPSHTAALRQQEFLDAVRAAGMTAQTTIWHDHVLPVEMWLRPSMTARADGRRVREALEVEADGGEGDRPIRGSPRWPFGGARQRWLLCTAE